MSLYVQAEREEQYGLYEIDCEQVADKVGSGREDLVIEKTKDRRHDCV